MAEPAPQYPVEEEFVEEPQTYQAANDNELRAPGERRRLRIGTPLALLLVTVAVSFDATQFAATFLHVIPLVGNAAAFIVTWYIGVFSQIVFGVWFMFIGADGSAAARNFATRILIFMSTLIAELVPLINALPAITLGVVALILLSRAEDMFGDVRGIPLSRLTTLVKGHIPLMQQANAEYKAKREEVRVREEALRAEREERIRAVGMTPGQPNARYQDQFKQQRMAEAMNEGISNLRFVRESEERAADLKRREEREAARKAAETTEG